jgi:complex iron-sulfur molybdoenzyme family reductase subunit beta
MDMLIAYQHADMFRLDNAYYQSVAKEKGLAPFPLLDNRYLKGREEKVSTAEERGEDDKE